jgi:hypothetical protein
MNLFARLATGVYTILAVYCYFAGAAWWFYVAYLFTAICSLSVATKKYFLPAYIIGVFAAFGATVWFAPGINELRYLDSARFGDQVYNHILSTIGLLSCFLTQTFYMFKANHRRTQWKGFKKYYY